jgi:hypothetical protein
MLAKAKELDIDFEALGERMLERKKELLEDGIPTDAEHALLAKSGSRADSPAAAAARGGPPRGGLRTTAPRPGAASASLTRVGDTWRKNIVVGKL